MPGEKGQSLRACGSVAPSKEKPQRREGTRRRKSLKPKPNHPKVFWFFFKKEQKRKHFFFEKKKQKTFVY